MKKKTLQKVIYLIVIGIILGFLKVEFFLNLVNSRLETNARIMSYITLLIGSVFFYFVVILSIFICYLTLEISKLGSKFNIDNFYSSINIFINFLIVNEFSKLIITFITFRGTENINSDNEFMNEIKNNTLWVNLMEYSDIFFIIFGAIVFSIHLAKKDKNVSQLNIAFAIIPLCASFFIFKYLS